MAIITDGGANIIEVSARDSYDPANKTRLYWPMDESGVPMIARGSTSAGAAFDIQNGTPQYQYAQYGDAYTVRFDHEDTTNNELVDTGNLL